MRISVICIGNELLLDEGVGPACARYMNSRYRFPENVEVYDRACMGMAIISDLRDSDFALVLDAVDVPDARPGQIFSFEPDDVAPTQAGMLSTHDVRFADVLASASFLGIECRGHCFGIQVENMSPSQFVIGLTPRVAAAVPFLAQAAVRYLRGELGVEVEDLMASQTAQPVVPTVYGEPDTSLVAEYLASSLASVGASGEVLQGDLGQVLFKVPEGFDGEKTYRGLVIGEAEQKGWASVKVCPQTTDLDCDCFIGACAELCRKVG